MASKEGRGVGWTRGDTEILRLHWMKEKVEVSLRLCEKQNEYNETAPSCMLDTKKWHVVARLLVSALCFVSTSAHVSVEIITPRRLRHRTWPTSDAFQAKCDLTFEHPKPLLHSRYGTSKQSRSFVSCYSLCQCRSMFVTEVMSGSKAPQNAFVPRLKQSSLFQTRRCVDPIAADLKLEPHSLSDDIILRSATAMKSSLQGPMHAERVSRVAIFVVLRKCEISAM